MAAIWQIPVDVTRGGFRIRNMNVTCLAAESVTGLSGTWFGLRNTTNRHRARRTGQTFSPGEIAVRIVECWHWHSVGERVSAGAGPTVCCNRGWRDPVRLRPGRSSHSMLSAASGGVSARLRVSANMVCSDVNACGRVFELLRGNM